MILNRIATAIRQQDWFVVVLEIFIVVFGVFIGLQVDDWNEVRKERAEETVILKQLGLEVETAILAKEKDLIRIQENSDLVVGAVKVIQENEGKLSPDQCGALWRSHILLIDFNGLLTFEELALSGKLRILSNTELRQSLIAFQSQTQSDRQFLDFVQQDFVVLPDVFADLVPRTLNIETLERSADCQLEEIRKNQTFKNSLQSNLGRGGGLIARLEREITKLQSIRDLIEGA